MVSRHFLQKERRRRRRRAVARIGRRLLRDLKVRAYIDFWNAKYSYHLSEFYADPPITPDEHEEEEDLYDE
jgi:hypothetical protein